MAKIYSNSDLCEIFKSDWTQNPTFDSPNLQDANGENIDFMKTFVMQTVHRWPEYVDEFKEYLIYNNGFMSFTDDTTLAFAKLNEKPERFEIVVAKSKILDVLNFLKLTRCSALKLCFGINSPLGSGGIHRILVTGSYEENEGFTPDQIVDNLLKINGDGIYFPNFEISMALNSKVASGFNKNFEATITNQNEKRVMGYVLGINTFLSMLTNDEYLGKAENIRFSLAMNKYSPYESEGQIILVKIDSPEIDHPLISYYLFDKDIDENDEFDCPPRKPCSTIT